MFGGYRESRFVGGSRLGLVEVFEGVVSKGSAGWVSLEAPAGWGKTRVGHEFYAWLAAGQPFPAYWPERIDDPVRGRRAVHPLRFLRRAGSLPGFLWWGIDCSTRGRAALDALRGESLEFDRHAVFLEAARRALVSAREVAESERGQALGQARWAAAEEAVLDLEAVVLGHRGCRVPPKGRAPSGWSTPATTRWWW